MCIFWFNLFRHIVPRIKSVTAREIFKKVPDVKKQLWGGEFWTSGYFISTVGKHGDENVIKNYVKNQGKKNISYKILHKQKRKDNPNQLMFEFI